MRVDESTAFNAFYICLPRSQPLPPLLLDLITSMMQSWIVPWMKIMRET